MNKQDMLADYKKQDDKLCLAQVLDKIEISNKRNKIEYTDFLDMYQVSLVENFLKKNQIENYKLYGGYEYAERKILIVYSDKFDNNMIEILPVKYDKLRMILLDQVQNNLITKLKKSYVYNLSF